MDLRLTTSGRSQRGGRSSTLPVEGAAMASVKLLWADGSDIHVLKNETSPALIDRLLVEDDSVPVKREPAELAPDIDTTTFTFKPNFLSTTTPPAPPSNAGISVNTATGAVTVPPSLGASRLRSFVL